MSTQTAPPSASSTFSVDLVSLAKQHIAFLQTLHSHGISLSTPSLESLRRYRDLWLPLVHTHAVLGQGPNESPVRMMIPPADIAWLWHCHRLAPFHFSSYCQKRFEGRIIEASPPFAVQFEHSMIEVFWMGATQESERQQIAYQTIQLWTDVYPDEPFHLKDDDSIGNLCDSPTEEDAGRATWLDGFNLLDSTQRQATFLWQVSAPAFSRQTFLEEGLVQYFKFLKLRAFHPNLLVVPTYQIDLMWHTHMLASITFYYQDCESIIGSRLHHDDSLNDRTEGGRLDTAFRATKEAWYDQYGENYHVVGGMYRGEPPSGFYDPAFGLFGATYNGNFGDLHRNKHPENHHHPFDKFIGVQGASSTNPSSSTEGNMQVIWCWKETASHMPKWPPSDIVGKPEDCWVKYSSHDNETLESAYQSYGESSYHASVTLGNGVYKVEFGRLKQTKKDSGFERDVQRFVQVHETNGSTSLAETLSPRRRAETTKPSPAQAVAVAVAAWTDLDGFSPDGCPAFLPANPRSAGVNANPHKTDYIFGEGQKGFGYYHTSTRDAYRILSKRIGRRIAQLESDIGMILCCDCRPKEIQRNDPRVLQKEVEIAQLTEIQKIILARSAKDVPTGEVGLPASSSSLAMSKNGTTATRSTGTTTQQNHQFYGDGGVWYFPPVFYDSGGGCGAMGASGGGCGGTCHGVSLVC